MMQAGVLIGLGGLLTFLYNDYKRATDPEFKRREDEEWNRARARRLAAQGIKVPETTKPQAEGDPKEEEKEEKTNTTEEMEKKTKSKAAKSAPAKKAVKRQEPEEEDALIGFVKGAVLGYCLGSFIVFAALYMMLAMGHDVETLMRAYTSSEDFTINWENTNDFFLALSLQKEFLVVKLALAGCLARPLQKYLNL